VDAVQEIEEVVRSWEFAASNVDGVLRLTADTSNDSVDWESGTNLRIECNAVLRVVFRARAGGGGVRVTAGLQRRGRAALSRGRRDVVV
jgi:hypothetical protein